ncbi:MAG: CARDB domain-containing protein [bacterium]|nr:CARDB domain-containing protein [bacterium]
MNGTYNATHTTPLSTNEAVLRGLAIVGFIALVGLGIWLAIYSARFVPATMNRLGAAAVALTSIFRPGDASLSVVPNNTSTTTLPFAFGNSTATSTATTTPPKPSTGSNSGTKPGQQTGGTYPIGGSASSTPFGQPDLVTSILAVGYLASSTTDSFVATSTVPAHGRAAVKFLIKNVGTNIISAGWRFSASIPTQSAYIFQSQSQQGLNPSDSIEYILGFDQANPGNNQTISITADFDRLVGESNENNNSASANLIILGS